MSLNDTPPEPTTKLCECGCGQTAPLAPQTSKKRGWVKGQPLRFAHGHNRRRSAVERFWEKVNKDAPNGCWEWTGSQHDFGYGSIYVNNKMMLTHRFSYELHNGPIPPNMFCCHTCDNPRCCNPQHLFLGSNNDNVSDMIKKGRDSRGTGSAKLTEAQVIEIRQKYAQGSVTHMELASEYGLDRSSVSSIIRRRTWSHIP